MKKNTCLIGLVAALLAFQASGQEVASLTMSWNDNSTNEDGFVVERSIDDIAVPVNWEVVETTEPDVTSFTDAEAPLNQLVTYRVKAFNSFGDSGYSNLAAVRTAIPDGDPSAAEVKPTSQVVAIDARNSTDLLVVVNYTGATKPVVDFIQAPTAGVRSEVGGGGPPRRRR